jgi:hypothetical protein
MTRSAQLGVARMGEIRSAYKVSVGNPEGGKGRGLDSTSTGQVPVAGFYEQ